MYSFIKARWFNFQDFIKTFFCFWIFSPRFALIDFTLLMAYFFKSPYSIVKAFTKGEEPYGETPLVEMQKIVQIAQINQSDCVFELGCGRGRTCFWLAEFVGCQVVGIEIIPLFVSRAERIGQAFSVSNAHFRLENLLKTDFSKATVLYLFGTCLPDDDVAKFIEACKTLKRGTKIITISYALTEYDGSSHLELQETFDITFSWGTTEAYLQVKS